jgi:dGTPase
LAAVRRQHSGLDENRTIQEMVRRVMDLMVADVLAETERRLAALKPTAPVDIRQADRATIAFSPAFWDGQMVPLRTFLHANVYRHYRVSRMRHKIRRVVRELFELFMDSPQLMPPDFRNEPGREDPAQRARMVADYIAGMTDRFALEEHHRLFDPMAKT